MGPSGRSWLFCWKTRATAPSRGEDPVVTISARPLGKQVALTVADNGLGIPAHELPRVFDRGFTGSNGRGTAGQTVSGGSTGMGLYLCKKIAGFLELGQYLIHCMTYLEDALKACQEPLTLGEAALLSGGVHTERLSQGGGLTNGRGYVLVAPDEAVEGLAVHHKSYAARTVQPVPYGCFYELTDLMDRVWAQTGFEDHITTQANEEAEVASQTALIVFPMYYLTLALMMTAATILTIQQLSETGRYRSQFALLRKLGMNRREMARALRTQFVIYYALPALPPLLIGIPFIFNLAGLPEPGVMVGMSSPAAITVISLGIFAAIYAVYILLAYTSLKRDVLPA